MLVETDNWADAAEPTKHEHDESAKVLGEQSEPDDGGSEDVKNVIKKSSIATVLVSGVALFSDGYTAQSGESFDVWRCSAPANRS